MKRYEWTGASSVADRVRVVNVNEWKRIKRAQSKAASEAVKYAKVLKLKAA